MQVSKKIIFFYPEQSDFSVKENRNNFDAESLIFLNGKIHLFTKEWKSKNTTHYTINPEKIDMQAAEKIETYKTKFLVTDAAYFEEKLYLISHTKSASVYLQVFNQSENETFFTKKPENTI